MEEDNSNLIFDLDNDPITIMYKNMISKQIKQPLEWCLFSEKYKAITQVYNNQQCIEILVHKIGGTIIFAISNRFTFGHVQEMNGYPNMLSMYVYGTRWRQRSIFSNIFDSENSIRNDTEDCDFLSKIFGFKKSDSGKTITVENTYTNK